MKQILFIGVFILLGNVSYQTPDHYDILLDSIGNHTVETVVGMDSYSAFKFSESDPITVSLSDIPLSIATISSHYIINAIFKLEKVKSSYLFAIVDSTDSKIQLGLYLNPAGKDITRITFYSAAILESQMYFTVTAELESQWTKLMIDVNDDSVTLSINCEVIDEVNFKKALENFTFSKDAMLHLGYGGNIRKGYFKDAIQEIKLYPEANEFTKHDICGDVSLPPSTTEYGDGDYDEKPLAESLTKFLDPPILPPPPPFPAEKGEKGDMGVKGEPGESITGPQGPIGPPGSTGLRGKDGENGKCECTEDTVSKLLESLPKMRGPPGPPGAVGADGNPGTVGLTGKPGEQGERGPLGLKGDRGEPGADGGLGPQGIQGLKGDLGLTGAPGPQGPPGSPGPPGTPGETHKDTERTNEVSIPGEKGDKGPIGLPGIQGERGNQGERGEKGIEGEKGDRGHSGIEGPRGEKGERGESGRDGIPGAPGAHGRSADKGDKGEQGDRGDQGPPGKPAKLIDILDPELDSAEGLAIVEKLRGFKGEIGEKGERGHKGDRGEKGATGDPGNDGRHGIPGERGPRGHSGETGNPGLQGQKGEQGPPGPSMNIPGTTVELMKGQKGDAGIQGKQGPKGHYGPKGQRGSPGFTGAKGAHGNPGSPGAKGSEGPQGKDGPKGDKGETVIPDFSKISGFKGEKGDAGEAGPAGPPGPISKCNSTNYIPVTGSPGPPGPPGMPGLSITGLKGEPGGILSRNTLMAFNHRRPDAAAFNNEVDEDDWYTAGTVIFQSTTALIKRTSASPLGTLAYIVREQSLLLRVETGWQYVTMGSILHENEALLTPVRPHGHVLPVKIQESPRKRKNFLRLAALNTPYSGQMFSFHNFNTTGSTAANADCRWQSQLAGYDGNFVAFLSTSIQDLKSIVHKADHSLPVVNTHGDVIFDSWTAMFNGSGGIFSNRTSIFSFKGKNIFIDRTWQKKVVWHGGKPDGQRSVNALCNDWQTNNPSLYGAASSLHNNKLLTNEKYSCDNKLIVLCVEISSHDRRLRRHPKSSRRKIHYQLQQSNGLQNLTSGLT